MVPWNLSAEPPKDANIDPKVIGYWALLWILFIMLAQMEAIRPIIIALAWLLAISVLMLLLDPNNPANILKKGILE